MLLALDLLHQDGVDVSATWLGCAAGVIAYLHQVETFPDRAILFDYCNTFGFEALSASATARATPAGRAATGLKVKFVRWTRTNAEPWRAFEATQARAAGGPESAGRRKPRS